MFLFKCSRNASINSSGLISEEISPILRESTGSQNNVNWRISSSFYEDEKQKETDDKTAEVVTRLKEVTLKLECENCPLPKNSTECSEVKKSKRFVIFIYLYRK